MSVRKVTKPSAEAPNAAPLAVLERTALFGVLDAESLRRLMPATVSVRPARGQVYQLRGARVNGVVIVVRGFLRICLSNVQGKRHVLSQLEAGQIFNLLPVVDGGPAIHDAEAGADTELLVLPTARYRDLQREHPAVAEAAQRLLNARARLVYDGLADAMLLTLQQRCARSLLQAMSGIGEPFGAGGAVAVRLSQSDIADMLGNARPVVNRVLRQMERDGVIELGYQRVVILQPEALRAIAGG